MTFGFHLLFFLPFIQLRMRTDIRQLLFLVLAREGNLRAECRVVNKMKRYVGGFILKLVMSAL